MALSLTRSARDSADLAAAPADAHSDADDLGSHASLRRDDRGESAADARSWSRCGDCRGGAAVAWNQIQAKIGQMERCQRQTSDSHLNLSFDLVCLLPFDSCIFRLRANCQAAKPSGARPAPARAGRLSARHRLSPAGRYVFHRRSHARIQHLDHRRASSSATGACRSGRRASRSAFPSGRTAIFTCPTRTITACMVYTPDGKLLAPVGLQAAPGPASSSTRPTSPSTRQATSSSANTATTTAFRFSIPTENFSISSANSATAPANSRGRSRWSSTATLLYVTDACNHRHRGLQDRRHVRSQHGPRRLGAGRVPISLRPGHGLAEAT